ncbi:MAG: SRPBCC family protein [Hyphomicrobiales bacterium]|nr:MAG: SRPBCC family protein [Hyphomicrobiales bacterium]
MHEQHFGDDAPERTAKHPDSDGFELVGHAVTIDRPRSELYAFWRTFENLPRFMENVEAVRDTGRDTAIWTIKAPGGSVEIETHIVADQQDERIGWASVEGSDVETSGSVSFRDAGPRGTIVEAEIAYKPPGGDLGKWIAKLFQREPNLQGRQELKRFKMLMETGEIAIAKPDAADKETA